jgi:hypothetical protein
MSRHQLETWWSEIELTDDALAEPVKHVYNTKTKPILYTYYNHVIIDGAHRVWTNIRIKGWSKYTKNTRNSVKMKKNKKWDYVFRKGRLQLNVIYSISSTGIIRGARTVYPHGTSPVRVQAEYTLLTINELVSLYYIR